MRNFVTIISILALVACAQVPYDESGRIIVPQTANFATQAREGTLDRALDELVVKIDPGQEEIRAATAIIGATLIYCHFNNCRRNRGTSATVRNTIVVSGQTSSRTNTETLIRRFEGLERTQMQVGQLADMSTAFAIMAERDSVALATSGARGNAQSWIDLYDNRLAKLVAARDPLMNHVSNCKNLRPTPAKLRSDGHFCQTLLTSSKGQTRVSSDLGSGLIANR